MLFTHPATRVIVAKIKSPAVQTFQSRIWGKDVPIARTHENEHLTDNFRIMKFSIF
jgi:hypothetical protein